MPANAENSSPDQSASAARSKRGKLPPLKSLLAFEAAARFGSFAKAANELGVTASAVSHHIQLLEEFLGVKLFERHAGRATPTSPGRIYARDLDRAFGMIAEATNLVAPQSQAGHLVIAVGPSFAAKWLQPRLPDFLRLYPDLNVRVSTLSDHADLVANRFDIAIAYALPTTNDLDVEPLLVERLRPLCSPALAAALALKRPHDLARATLIHSTNTLTWSDYLRRVGIGDVRPAKELWLDRSSMAIEAAVDGLGVVLESELLVEEELRDGRLVAPFDDGFSLETTSYFLVRSPGLRSGSHKGAFEKWLRAAIGARPPARP